jgi:alpha-beta hydrolase superfamily lysophospholipase
MQDFIVGFLEGHKGVKLCYRYYSADNSTARIIFLHGAGEYSEKYTRFAEWFASRNIEVFLLDMRGHGRSGGPICHVSDFNDYAQDLDIFLKFTEKGWGQNKTFLVAHSLGGLVALFYCLNFSYNFRGVIACSPCLGLRLRVEPIKAWLALFFSKFLADKPFASNIKPRAATHDKYILEKFREDPLIHHAVTASFYVQLKTAMRYLAINAAGFKKALLVLPAGDDRICSCKAAEKFYNTVSSTDKKFQLYTGFYHELLNELKKEEVFDDIYKWIKARC